MNNYHIYEQQAKGKYSVIFKARKKKKLEFVAIKRLQKTRKAKVYNEAQILSQLNNHPNIIKFHDFMQTKNHMWQITQYCPGGDLLKIIQYDKQLPQQTVRNFVLEILAGMHYSHSKGIVICDIKPASILINEYGDLKIGDFGAAQKLVDLMRSAKGKKKGTPSYMAPELFDANGVYSFQSDLWAVGCIMYELAQGNPPFVSTNFQQIAELSRLAATPRIEHFSNDFNTLLCSLLQKDPVNRIQWKNIIKHPWIRYQLPQLQIPQQNHFLQYIQQRSKSRTQKLRVSHNFENQSYGNDGKLTASDRREVFEFENYNEGNQEGYENENEYYEEQERMGMYEGSDSKVVLGVEVNMKKNKNSENEKTKKYNNDNKDTKPIKQKGVNQYNKPHLPTNKPVSLQDSTTINSFLQTMTTKPSLPLQQALNHQSDTAVKPIIGNKDIQLIQSINFNKNQLGFTYIEPQLLAQGIVNQEVDDLLKKILQGMKGEERINVLGYFETIVQNSEVANELFKSNYIPYYMSLLKTYKQSSLRAKICEVLGLLIRHATAIESDILKYGIINGFIQTVTKDKNDKVKRKAMAALGQLLFYGATQVDQDALQWDISLSLINTLFKILKNTNQDEIVRIYCCKTIENITAQAQRVGLNFSQMDSLMVMIGCFNSTKNQGFKTSIMCSIHHMISLNPTLRQVFLEKTPTSSFIETLSDSQTSPKTIQILLWIFLQQLMKSPKSKISKSLMQNRQLVKAILGLMDSSVSVVKGRVYLFIYFLLTYEFRKISIIAQSKLFHSIERHGKESGKYESQSLQFVVSILYENFHLILKLCSQQLQHTPTPQKNSFIIIISQMQSCSLFQQLFNSQQNVQYLMNFMQQKDKLSQGEKVYLQSFKNYYFLIMEKIFFNQATTQKLQQFYCSYGVPFLIGKVLKTVDDEIRYSCIKYLICLVNFCLSQQFLYDSTILTSTSSKISSLIINHLIPQLDTLFDQGESVTNMMFKLTAEIFRNRIQFILKFWESCNLEKVLTYYGQNSTINVLKTIEQLFSCSPGNAIETKYASVIGRFWAITISMLTACKSSGHEQLLEYHLAIITNLLNSFKSLHPNQSDIDKIYQLSIGLQSHEDNFVSAKAEQLIEVLLKKKMFSEKGLQDWKNLSKKGIENYELFIKLSGLKSNNIIKSQKESRPNH